MRSLTALAAAATAALTAAPAAAQEPGPQLPSSFVAPNYDRVFVGVAESHEAGSHLARTRGPAATWYNPAGIATISSTAFSVNVRGIKAGFLSLDEPFESPPQITEFAVLPLFLAVVLGPEVVPWRDVRIGISGTEQTAWSTLAWWGTTTATGHSTYVSDSSLSSYVLAGNVGWAVSPRLRLGASLGTSWTRLWEYDRLSALEASGAPVGSLRTRLLSGVALHVVPAVSVQWEPAPWIALGAVARAPGWPFWSYATLQVERQDTTAAGNGNLFLQTGDAEFEFRYPLELQGGVALRSDAWEVELDARFHASAGSYDLVAADVPLEVVTSPPGGPPAQSSLAPIRHQTRAVVDLSLGGSLALGGGVRLHGGIYACPSPVAEGATHFRRTDLYGARAGVSFQGERVSGSIGLGYETGLSSATPGLVDLAGVAVNDQIRVQLVSLTFAAEYQR